MEVELGITQLDRRDPRQASALRLWLHERVLPAFAGRILPIDAATGATLLNPWREGRPL